MYGRRAVLRAAGLVGSGAFVAGSSGAAAARPSRDGDRSASTGQGATDPGQRWPAAGYDASNRGHNPSALAPTADPSVEWTFDVSVDHVDGGEKPGGPGKVTGSAATVVDGAVYFGDTGHGVHENFLYAVDAATGELRWRRALGVDGVRSTPTVAGGRIYVGNGDNRLTAIDAATGAEAWAVDVGRNTVNSDRVRDPTVVGETIYFGADRNDRLHAANLTDGAIRWSFDAGRTVRGAPVVRGDVVYATASRNGRGVVYAIDAGTGRETWRREYGSNTSIGNLPPPVAGNGFLYVGDTRFGRVHALDPDTGEDEWSAETDGSMVAPPAIAGCAVFVGTKGGTLYALDGGSGEGRWKTTLAGAVTAAPTVANGVVYVGDGAGHVHAVDATDGAPLWTKRLDGRVTAAPTPSGGRVFVSGEERLYAVGGTVDDRRGAVEAATCAVGTPARTPTRAGEKPASDRTAGGPTSQGNPSGSTVAPGQPGFTVAAGVLGTMAGAATLAVRRLDR